MTTRTLLTAALLLVAATTVRCSDSVAPNQPPVDGGTDADASSADGGAVSDGGLNNDGGEDGGVVDGGQDGGLPDSGLANLPPEDPACVGHMGPGDQCWGEWLKEMGKPDFTPVARGELGAGPWPTQAVTRMGSAEGIEGGVVGVSVDTGQNIYAVTDSALFIRRAGQAKFVKYARGTNGLRDFGFLSVAGAKSGQAFVGHIGLTPESEFDDPPTDPPAIRQSGDIERIDLTATGIAVTPYDTHNSNSGSGAFDHMRSINNIVIPRRGPAAGEMYLTSEHAVARYQGDKYAVHRHVTVSFGGSMHFGAAKALTVTDQGTMWYGSDYELGGLAFTPRLYEWYFDAPWLFPTNAYGSEADQDRYEGIGVDSKGDVWAAARGHGLVHLEMTSPRHADVHTLGVPDSNLNDLMVDVDDSIWVATDGGVYRYDPLANSWSNIKDAHGGVMHLFLDDTVTPRAVYIGDNNGVLVYRDP